MTLLANQSNWGLWSANQGEVRTTEVEDDPMRKSGILRYDKRRNKTVSYLDWSPCQSSELESTRKLREREL